MTLWSRATSESIRLWKLSTVAIRRLLARRSRAHAEGSIEADSLHPRCCRTEHYF
jgi:hypothetical protein